MSQVPVQFTITPPEVRRSEGMLPNSLGGHDSRLGAGSEPHVLLVTTGHLPSTARLAIECGTVGARVSLLAPRGNPAEVVTSISNRLTFSAISPLQSLRRAILTLEPDLLIPCDERVVRYLHRLHRETALPKVRSLIERSLGSPSGYALASSRHALLSAALTEGVRAPATAAIDSLADLKTWHGQYPFPWVVKADGSWAGFGVRVVKTWSEAATAFDEMRRPVGTMLTFREALLERDWFWVSPWLRRVRPVLSVQSYVDGWPANCAVACWNGEVMAGICAESVKTHSTTGPSTVARVIDNPQMIEAAARVAQRIGATGLIGFDFMIEAATGIAHMIEMNPRVTPICNFPFGHGKDLIEALLARVANRPQRERPPVTERDILVFFPHTWRQDPFSPFLQSGYHDVPWEEPELVRRLMRPELRDRYWFTRTLRRLRTLTKGRPQRGPHG